MSTRSNRRGGTSSSARRSPRDARRRPAGPAAATPAESGASFWGDGSALPAGPREVRSTEDPSAMVRSLGPPPLPGRESVSEYYFATVYERAAALARALAAAGGLVTPESLGDEDAD